jgi:hypothetical protein
MLVGATRAQNSCADTLFRGLDSRLKADLLGRVPVGRDPVVGFEIVHGKGIIAYPLRIVGVGGSGAVSIASPDVINAIAVDSSDELIVQTEKGIRRVNREGALSRDPRLTAAVHGKLLGSGTLSLLDVAKSPSTVSFTAVKVDGSRLPIVSAEGEFRTANWTQDGLATVVSSNLLFWPKGGAQLLRVVSDTGLRGARDLCVVGAQQVVAALNDVLILVTPENRLILAGMRARCRWSKGALFILDEKSGYVWRATGLEQLGSRESDEAYAVGVLQKRPTQTSAEFMEAARILGCQRATQVASSLPPPR